MCQFQLKDFQDAYIYNRNNQNKDFFELNNKYGLIFD